MTTISTSTYSNRTIELKIKILHFYLALGVTLMCQLADAQHYRTVPQFYPIMKVQDCSVAFEDLNGDNYPDLLISGLGEEFPPLTKLYFNDGMGNFLEQANTPFINVHFSAIAIADVNGDSFSDIVISGDGTSWTLPMKLYINDGVGNFSEMAGLPEINIRKAAIAVDDINGDEHPDMIVSGRTAFSKPTTKILINDGTGHFTEVKEIPLIDVYNSAIAIQDINGDKSADVLIGGLNSVKEPITKLYINDGKGRFTEIDYPVITGINDGSVALEDMNGDGHPDILISGESTGYKAVTKLYTNDGIGNFTESLENSFYEGFYSSIAAVEDLNGDRHLDVLVTGRQTSGAQFTKLYINDGKGNFAEKKNNLAGVSKGAIATTDVNNDTYPDLLIAGRTRYGDKISNLYLNDGTGIFSEKFETITGVYGGHISIADVNGDQHPDMFIAGLNNDLDPVMKLYFGDSTGNFTKDRKNPFKGKIKSISIADVNNDDFPDVLVTGWDYRAITKLYLNDGTGDFTEIKDTPFDGVIHGSSVIRDLNGDHYPDVIISGDVGDSLITKLYLNNGSGDFIESKDSCFTGTELSSIVVANINGDKHPDIIISGIDNESNVTTDLYATDSLGRFEKVMDSPFIGGTNSIIATDINGDDFTDLLIAGTEDGYTATKLYTNDGLGNFTEVENNPIDGIHDNSIAVGDLNGDNLPDIISYGSYGAKAVLKLYMNEGEGKYSEISETPFIGLTGGTITIADINGDNRSDVIIAGESSTRVLVTTLYINDGW